MTFRKAFGLPGRKAVTGHNRRREEPEWHEGARRKRKERLKGIKQCLVSVGQKVRWSAQRKKKESEREVNREDRKTGIGVGRIHGKETRSKKRRLSED